MSPTSNHIVVGVVPGRPAAVVAAAATFADRFGADLICATVDSTRYTVVHGWDGGVVAMPIDPDLADETVETFDADLHAAIAAVLDPRGVSWSTRALAGNPSHELARLAEEVGAAMIVVGTRESGIRESLREFFSGSVAVQLAHHQRRPVVVVPLNPVDAAGALPWQQVGRRVLLVRHGRTALNAEGRLRGLADPELDPVGVAQAEATAAALRRYRIGRVVSGPLDRAVTTARIIATANGVESEVDPAFNDRDYGPWTGHLRSEVIERFGTVDNAPGVEPATVARDRAFAAIRALEPNDRPVAIVTHDAIIRPLLLEIDASLEPIVDTGSWAEIVSTEEGWTVVSVDNTAGDR